MTFTKVKVDVDLCIGCGTCPAVCPKVFKIGETGKSAIIKKDGTTSNDWVNFTDVDDTPESVQGAVDSCPTRAILVE
ncbi:MAG: Ferredoxin, ferredoxin [Candidatus Peregrinibacteria bacterium GW2011_GWF2_38_29]|nr:MAG: Ferredoxin, ferredoxin [Candidatus Peregrinibacteria bacterium GW2011_GWF2_38_29]HBB02668.1 ferredoxin [Candidatus Peregrinibacteria bacterium]